MCGIVGYVGHREAAEFLIEGLRRLEYRGYDSAGVATATAGDALHVVKAAGRIDGLAARLDDSPAPGTIGIGHTRWATHGAATDENAHPHLGGADGVVAICHNGVIENYAAIKAKLQRAGCVFHSATDTEVIAQLIAQALEQALADGIDASPLVGFADKIVYLADHQLAVITADTLQVTHRDLGHVEPRLHVLDLDPGDVDLGNYPHYMLKEIFEQPETVRNTMRGRLSPEQATAVFGGLNLTATQLRNVDRIVLTGCGTSWHAGLVGEYLIEEFARIPVEVEYGSELRYRNPPLDKNTLLFAITQSGETADTLAALREVKRKGHPTLAICNVVGSTIAQEADGGVYLHAGPEIGVASTKAFTSQCVALAMLALYFGRLRHLSYGAGRKIIDRLAELPERIAQALETNDAIRDVAAKYYHCTNFLYLGRQYNFPAALEGALKLKEISYIHAEGYPAAEMKHGPIALVDEHTPSVFLIPHGLVYDKVMSNLEEIKARGGPVIAIVSEGDRRVAELADDVIHVPAVEDFLQPIVTSIPLQLLAYHIAVLRGCDVDKPRNLAKSVTVE